MAKTTKRSKRVRTRKAGITEKPKEGKLVSAEKVKYERELRRYVKKSGGFRKDLPDNEIDIAKKLMKRLKRNKPEWDESIHVPGIDNPTVAGMNIA